MPDRAGRTPRCESLLSTNAAMRDEPQGAMASATTPRVPEPVVGAADSPSPRNQFLEPARSGGSSSAISHSADPRDSCLNVPQLDQPVGGACGHQNLSVVRERDGRGAGCADSRTLLDSFLLEEASRCCR